jgi:hypothetical protein
MTSSDIKSIKSHFWIAAAPFFSSTILVASGSSGVAGETIEAQCELFDVDGTPIQRFQVEFPSREVGIIEVEPFMAGLKMQSGIIQGHLAVQSRAGTTHLCRQQVGDRADILTAPRGLKSREMSFMPLLLGGRREHLVVVVSTGPEDAQVVIRLLYGSRSPEWTVQIPGNGCRIVSLEHELLATFDDSSWHKGVMQGYLRISPRSQSAVVCQMVERLPGETEEHQSYRSVSSW